MQSRQDVNKTEDSNKLLSSWVIVVVIMVGIGIGLYFLFPTDYFERHFEKKTKISETSLIYLEQLNKQFGDNEELQLNKIRHLIGLGYVKRAKHALKGYKNKNSSPEAQEEVKWLGYILAREEFYKLKKTDPNYASDKKKLAGHLKSLLFLTDTEQEYKLMATDSMSLGIPDFSTQIFKKLFNKYPNQSVTVYVKAARAALYGENYVLSSNYFFKAQALEKSINKKLEYFMAGVSSLEAMGDAKKALLAAQKNIKQLPHSRKLMVFLTKIALRANNTAQAQVYLLQVIYKRKPNHEKA